MHLNIFKIGLRNATNEEAGAYLDNGGDPEEIDYVYDGSHTNLKTASVGEYTFAHLGRSLITSRQQGQFALVRDQVFFYKGMRLPHSMSEAERALRFFISDDMMRLQALGVPQHAPVAPRVVQAVVQPPVQAMVPAALTLEQIAQLVKSGIQAGLEENDRKKQAVEDARLEEEAKEKRIEERIAAAVKAATDRIAAPSAVQEQQLAVVGRSVETKQPITLDYRDAFLIFLAIVFCTAIASVALSQQALPPPPQPQSTAVAPPAQQMDWASLVAIVKLFAPNQVPPPPANVVVLDAGGANAKFDTPLPAEGWSFMSMCSIGVAVAATLFLCASFIECVKDTQLVLENE